MPAPSKTALVVCYSRLISDPRVIRQIGWLRADGWTIDTLGFGPSPSPDVREHFELTAGHAGLQAPAIRLGIHALLPRATAFRVLEESRIPSDLREPAALSRYDLLFVNDIDLLPWADRMVGELTQELRPARVHLDLHEYHKWEDSRGLPALARKVLARYHAWLLEHVASSAFTSRSTVAGGIADLYAERYSVPRPAIVRNAPAWVDQRPSTVDEQRIELLYHGNADLARGLHLLIEAMPALESRFHLTLMLTGFQAGKTALTEMTEHLADRVTFVPAVKMSEVAAEVNRFDVEVIFYPPTGPNYLFSFPNKFFEAVQGRLAIVVGQSPSMAEVVEEFHNGVVVDGWTAPDLARTINALSADDIRTMKAASEDCARELNSEQELMRFTAAMETV